ncbi:carboxymuconolactone decarboxylase family protein [Mycolicibacterium holsaticum]|uniref:Uncharacterized protein n=1 Tax=Mycolicibacterium holsaticum TaxID=152142 RepID=A0A1E3S2I6_9MYCO|nr:carboxymuconolactone decarboxylase family protein [Mycolicibacterium holsaticum]ODQ96383.1 hypothetical protein BHQ17_01540 [Mycolicibacterium holsaticum]
MQRPSFDASDEADADSDDDNDSDLSEQDADADGGVEDLSEQETDNAVFDPEPSPQDPDSTGPDASVADVDTATVSTSNVSDHRDSEMVKDSEVSHPSDPFTADSSGAVPESEPEQLSATQDLVSERNIPSAVRAVDTTRTSRSVATSASPPDTSTHAVAPKVGSANILRGVLTSFGFGPRAADSPVPAAPAGGALVNALWFAVRDIEGRPAADPASSIFGTGLFMPINSLFTVGERCGLICDGANGTQANPNGVGGGWLVGNGGAGWSSTVAGVAGGNGGPGGVFWGNGGNGGAGGLGAAGGDGGNAALLGGHGGNGGAGGDGINGGDGMTGLNGGFGVDGTAGGRGGDGGNAGLLWGRAGNGGVGGAGGDGGDGAHGTDAAAAEEDGGAGGHGGAGGDGGAGGAGGKGALLAGRGGAGGAGGAAGAGGDGGFGGTGGATVITLADGRIVDTDAVGGIAGLGGAAGQPGTGGVGGAGGVFGHAGVNGVSGEIGTAGSVGGEGGAGGLGGRLPIIDLNTATPAQAELAARMKAVIIPLRDATGIQMMDAYGRLVGPLNAYLYNTVIGEALMEVANASATVSLPARVKEVVVLSVGGLWGSDFELYAHEMVARLVGIPEEAIQSLASGQPPVGLTGNELLAAQFAQELISTRQVSDELYQAAEAAFGTQGVIEIVLLTGTYLSASSLFNAFELQGPSTYGPGVAPSPTPPRFDGDYGLGGRLALIDLETATPAQLALAAQIKEVALPAQEATGVQVVDSQGRLIGPFNGYLYSPVIGAALFDAENIFATSSLPDRVKEVAVLAVSGMWGTEYTIYAHGQTARLAGLPEEAIQSLANGQAPVGLTGDELIAAQLVQELVSTYQISDETYHAAEAAFGRAGVIDLINLTGTYLGTSAMLNAFEVPAPSAGAITPL